MKQPKMKRNDYRTKYNKRNKWINDRRANIVIEPLSDGELVNPAYDKESSQDEESEEGNTEINTVKSHGQSNFSKRKLITFHSEVQGEKLFFTFFDGKKHINGEGDQRLFFAMNETHAKYKRINIVMHDAYHQAKSSGIYSNLKSYMLVIEPKLVLEESAFIMEARSKDKRHFVGVYGFENFFLKTEMEDILKDAKIKLPEDPEGICKAKAEALYKCMQMIPFELQRTGASISNVEWRKQLSRAIKMPRWVNFRIEPAYRGGRIAAYRTTERPEQLYVYDVNSLYGQAMCDFRYSTAPVYEKILEDGVPIPLFPKDNETLYKDILDGQKPRSELSHKKDNRRNFVLFVSFSFPEATKRVIVPLKDISNVTGEFLNGQGLVTGMEFIDLIDTGAKVKVYSVMEFWNDDLFSSFVRDSFRRRTTTESKLMRKFYKLMIVSLAGKRGQQRSTKRVPQSWGKVPMPSLSKDTSTELTTVQELLHASRISGESLKYTIGNTLVKVYDDVVMLTKQYAQPLRTDLAIVAAEITANARHIMGGHILNVIEKNGAESLYYTNTDSLVTNCPIDDLIPIGTGLGEFKLEAEGMGEIFGINDWYVGEKVILGGIPSTSTEIGDRRYLIHNKETFRAPEKFSILDLNKKNLPRNLRYEKTDNGYIGLPKEKMRFPRSIPESKVLGVNIYSTNILDARSLLNQTEPIHKENGRR